MAALADDLKVNLQTVVSNGEVRPVDGISAAGQPDAAAFKVFADSGYAAVIDLRTERENRGLDEEAVVEGLGMDYVLMPIADTAAINFDNARRLDELLKKYDEPVLIHCGSSNRVGALLALRESLNGADDEGALQAGRDGGLTGLEGRVVEVLGEN
jgi:uncharacterized protein (TIGR01244 family)